MTGKERLEKIILSMDLKKELHQKVFDNYEEMLREGFREGDALFLVAAYFTGKPDETIGPLLRRLKKVMESRKDMISGAVLAASYYGIEELSMRLTILEEGVRNLYTDQKCVEALTGSIMIADGGPAEVAKAIQWYMFLMKNQYDMNNERMARLLGILAVISSPNILGKKMLSKITEKIEQNTKEESAADEETIFFEEACQFIKQLQRQEEERVNKMERTSYKMLTGEKNVTASDFDYSKEYHQEEEISLNGSNLFTGMKQEVDIILSAIYFDLI